MRLTRIAPLVALAALAAVAPVADAAPKTRVESYDYTLGTAAGPGTPLIILLPGFCAEVGACYDTVVKKDEVEVSFKATDATGQPVSMQVYLNDDYPGTGESYCGEGKRKVKAGTAVRVAMAHDPTCGSSPTQGTVELTFKTK